MPEGHALHRLAGAVDSTLGGRVLDASSPQGRFAAGAQRLDGSRLVAVRAHGKHLLVSFAPAGASTGPDGRRRRRARAAPPADEQVLHVHLGLYGKVALGDDDVPPERGALRLRLVAVPDGAGPDGDAADGDVPDGDAADGAGRRPWFELRGPTACELLESDEVAALEARLGPDPLLTADAAARERFVANLSRSRSAVGALLMRQDLVAGIGNIYRCELLFRAGVHPDTPGREVPPQVLADAWDDLVVLMRSGVRAGAIVTTAPGDRLDAAGRRTRSREGAHYVYHRTGLPCRVCATPVAGGEMVARTIFWCPTCQPRDGSGSAATHRR